MLNKKETILLVIIVCVLLALGLGLGIGLGMKKHHNGSSPTPSSGPCVQLCKTSMQAAYKTSSAVCKKSKVSGCQAAANAVLAEGLKFCDCAYTCFDNNNCDCKDLNSPPTCSTSAILKNCTTKAGKCPKPSAPT